MLFEDDAPTLDEADAGLAEAVEWLLSEGFLSRADRPFAAMLKEASQDDEEPLP